MPSVQRNGYHIHYDIRGRGKPLLLLNHSGVSNDGWHGGFLDALSAKYQLLLPEHRGTGASSDDGDYEMIDVARDALAVMDDSGVARADVFGISMGGAVAQELALAASDRVNRLVLAATFCGPRMSVPPERWTLPLFLRKPGQSPQDQIRRFLPVYYSREFLARHESMVVDLTARGAARNLRKTSLRQGLANRRFDTYDRLVGIQADTLILHGDADAIVPVANAHILSERLPMSRVVVLAGAGHVITTERPLETARLVSEFLGST